MTQNDLIAKTINDTVTDENGTSEEVEYTHRSPLSKETVRALIEYPKMDDEVKDDIVREIVFHSMHLTTEPEVGDFIRYDGQNWGVGANGWRKIGNGYDVKASISTNIRGRTR